MPPIQSPGPLRPCRGRPRDLVGPPRPSGLPGATPGAAVTVAFALPIGIVGTLTGSAPSFDDAAPVDDDEAAETAETAETDDTAETDETGGPCHASVDRPEVDPEARDSAKDGQIIPHVGGAAGAASAALDVETHADDEEAASRDNASDLALLSSPLADEPAAYAVPATAGLGDAARTGRPVAPLADGAAGRGPELCSRGAGGMHSARASSTMSITSAWTDVRVLALRLTTSGLTKPSSGPRDARLPLGTGQSAVPGGLGRGLCRVGNGFGTRERAWGKLGVRRILRHARNEGTQGEKESSI